MQYPDSLEGTGNYTQYAQTLEAMFTHSENDIENKHRTGILVLLIKAELTTATLPLAYFRNYCMMLLIIFALLKRDEM